MEGVMELPESPEVVEAMLSFLYKRCYTERATRSLEFHAQVYIAVEKYNIASLNLYAHRKTVPWLQSLGALFKSADSSVHEAALRADISGLLETVALVYDNTHDQIDVLRYALVATARKIVRRLPPGNVDDVWSSCFGQIPAFVIDLINSTDYSFESDLAVKTFDSRNWRRSPDCMVFQCGECEIAVIISDKSARAANSDGVYVTDETECPQSMTFVAASLSGSCPMFSYIPNNIEFEQDDHGTLPTINVL